MPHSLESHYSPPIKVQFLFLPFFEPYSTVFCFCYLKYFSLSYILPLLVKNLILLFICFLICLYKATLCCFWMPLRGCLGYTTSLPRTTSIHQSNIANPTNKIPRSWLSGVYAAYSIVQRRSYTPGHTFVHIFMVTLKL